MPGRRHVGGTLHAHRHVMRAATNMRARSHFRGSRGARLIQGVHPLVFAPYSHQGNKDPLLQPAAMLHYAPRLALRRGALSATAGVEPREVPSGWRPARLEQPSGSEVRKRTWTPFMLFVIFMLLSLLPHATELPVSFRLGSGAAGAPIHGTTSVTSLAFAAPGLISRALPTTSSTASSRKPAAIGAAAGQPPTTLTSTTSASPPNFATSSTPRTLSTPTAPSTNTSASTFASAWTYTSTPTFSSTSPPSTSSTSSSARVRAQGRTPQPAGAGGVGAASPPPEERALGHSVSPSAQEGASEARAKPLRPPLLSRKLWPKAGLSESQPPQQQQTTTATANSKRPEDRAQAQQGANVGQGGHSVSRPAYENGEDQ